MRKLSDELRGRGVSERDRKKRERQRYLHSVGRHGSAMLLSFRGLPKRWADDLVRRYDGPKVGA